VSLIASDTPEIAVAVGHRHELEAGAATARIGLAAATGCGVIVEQNSFSGT